VGEPGSPPTVAGGADTALGEGDVLLATGGTRLELRNTGPVPAVAVVTNVALTPVASSSSPQAPVASIPAAPGVTVETLAGLNQAVWLAPGRAVVAADRVSISPGASLLARLLPGLVLVVVEHGTLAAGVGGSEIEYDPGTWDTISSRSSTLLRSAGDKPLTILVVTVDTHDHDESPTASA
jgi:hypothetical protein